MSEKHPYEPPKWALNPEATLREIIRQEEDPGYKKTICGIHRIIWSIINVDLNGYIPEERLEDLNDLLEVAYRMGKRMDYRLRQYFLEKHGVSPEEALVQSATGKFVDAVRDYPSPIKDENNPSWKEVQKAKKDKIKSTKKGRKNR
jgi:hypothetical protein